MKVEEKLALNKYAPATQAHITVNKGLCADCDLRPCVYGCPADCFILKEDHVSFSYEGCLECGSCRIICPKGALQWAYPQGGFGICLQYG
ncbi:MAG: putative oxidoreductase Fe-S binding subunit [Syntrophorhabdus sp. PtaU1.Bin058]|nr:MAG: putative oxidoreductase Fe-S binding subunit [Syntrophorhabdus sp. PtaU1.Bin058]